MKLTEKEVKFCLKYFESGNGTRSVLDAGYKQTEKAAATTANRLLKKEAIQDRLNELRDKQEKRTEITADRVLKELGFFAFLDMSKAYDENEERIPLDKMPQDLRRAFTSRTEIKTADQIRALHLIGQHLKMFTEKHEHSGADGGAIQFSDHEAAAKLSAILNAARTRKGE